jgi:hypothetical protein
MTTTRKIGEDSKPVLTRAVTSTEQAERLGELGRGGKARHSLGGRASRLLSRQCSIRMRPVNVIISQRRHYGLAVAASSKDLRDCSANI